MTIVCAGLAIAKPHSHTVYPIFTHAAGEWLSGRDVYVEAPGFDVFRYSPAVAAFFGPWRLLGDAWGGAIWRVLGVMLLSGGLFEWSRHALNRGTLNGVAALFLLMAPFALQNVHNGQSNPHVLGMLLLATANVNDGRLTHAACWFVAAALFKPYVLAIVGLIAIIESRLWVRLGITIVIGFAIPFLSQSPSYVADQYGKWFVHLSGNDRGNMELRDAFRDVALLFRVYLWPIPPLLYQVGTAIVGLVLAAFTFRNKSSFVSRQTQVIRAFMLGSCWVTILGPATESCTYLLLAPTLAASILTMPARSNWWARVAYSLFVGTIAASLFPQDWVVQVCGPQPIAGLILLIVLVVDTFSRGRRVSIIQDPSLAAAA